MATNRENLAEAVRSAVRQFWRTRAQQAKAQGAKSGDRDRGARSAVTGGAHLDGFAELIRKLIVEVGVSDTAVHRRTRVELPGYYRAEKKWDLVVAVDGRLFATIEFKAQVGPSFGNNYNNRTEEALGNATDYWAAYREGAFRGSPRPWLGYLMLLEDASDCTTRRVLRTVWRAGVYELCGKSCRPRHRVFENAVMNYCDGQCLPSNNRLQRAALRAAGEPERWA